MEIERDGNVEAINVCDLPTIAFLIYKGIRHIGVSSQDGKRVYVEFPRTEKTRQLCDDYSYGKAKVIASDYVNSLAKAKDIIFTYSRTR